MNYISKRNRVALIYVVVLTIGIAYIPRVIGLNNSEKSEIKVSEAQISELNKRISNYNKNKKNYRKSVFEKKNKFKSPLVRFNPNNYSQSDWIYLGLSEKLSLKMISGNKLSPCENRIDLFEKSLSF